MGGSGTSSGAYVVRHCEPDDAEAITRIFEGPEAIAGTMQLPFPSVERLRTGLAEPEDGTYHLVACAGEEVVGSLVLRTYPQRPRRRHVGRIGMAVRDDHQGRGVGTALMSAAVDLADLWLNLGRLELDVFVGNEAAHRLYTRFGFTIEGTATAFAFRDGEYVDAHHMARVRAGNVGSSGPTLQG